MKKMLSLVMLGVALLFVQGCDDGKEREADGAALPAPELYSYSVTAGETVALRDDPSKLCPREDFRIEIDGLTVPLFFEENRSALVVPLFFDADANWSHPRRKASLRFFCGEKMMPSNRSEITIEPLPRREGLLEAAAGHFENIVADLNATVRLTVPEGSFQRGWLEATAAGMRALLERMASDIGRLRQEDPTRWALESSLTDLDGLERRLARLADMMQRLRRSAQSLQERSTTAQEGENSVMMRSFGTRSIGERASGSEYSFAMTVDDDTLALQMQQYVILDEFVRTFLHETAIEFDIYAKMALLIPGGEVAAGVGESIGLGFAFLDTVLSKFVLSGMPATVDAIELRIDDNLLRNSEETSSVVWVHASNAPVAFTLNDAINTVLQALSTISGAPQGTPEESVNDLVQYYIAVFNAAMERYRQAHPEADLRYDLDLYTPMPRMEWTARAETRALYRMGPLATEVVRPMEEKVEWKADETLKGRARLSIWPSSAPEARLLGDYLGVEYLGGAFGLSFTRSNEVDVVVTSLQIDRIGNDCFRTDESVVVRFRVGEYDEADRFLPIPGATIRGRIYGGTLENGNTAGVFTADAMGLFQFSLHPLAGVTSIRVALEVYDDSTGESVAKEFPVRVQEHCSMTIAASYPSCIDDEESITIGILVGEELEDTILGFGPVDLLFRADQARVNRGIGVAQTDENGRFALVFEPEEDAEEASVTIEASSASLGLEASGRITVSRNCTSEDDEEEGAEENDGSDGGMTPSPEACELCWDSEYIDSLVPANIDRTSEEYIRYVNDLPFAQECYVNGCWL